MNGTILLVHNGTERTGTEHLERWAAAAGFDVATCWAFAGDLPPVAHGWDGMIVTGSPHGVHDDLPFIAPEMAFLRAAAEAATPILGLCFGTQILGAALCGKEQVFRRPSCEVGFLPLRLTAEAATDPLLAEADEPLRMLVWHNDEVRHDHADMRILASSERCPNQIWRWRDAPVWGVQGHPEVTPALAPRWLENCRDALTRDGADTDSLIADSAEGARGGFLLDAFLDICRHGPAPGRKAAATGARG